MQTRARSTSNTLWDDVRELLEVWDEKNTALRADVQARLDRLKREGQSAWRRRVTGDANKRIRDHVRQTVDEAGERCVCLSHSVEIPRTIEDIHPSIRLRPSLSPIR